MARQTCMPERSREAWLEGSWAALLFASWIARVSALRPPVDLR